MPAAGADGSWSPLARTDAELTCLVTVGDIAPYNGLFGARFAVQSSDAFAQKIGFPRSPLDDLLVFHIVFGKTVPDISLNAVANLGYADCRFLKPVYAGDRLTVRDKVGVNAVAVANSFTNSSNFRERIVMRSRLAGLAVSAARAMASPSFFSASFAALRSVTKLVRT
jgi:acyl dehydratase